MLLSFLDVGFGETHRRGKGFDPPPDGEPKTDPRYVKAPRTVPRYPRHSTGYGGIYRCGSDA